MRTAEALNRGVSLMQAGRIGEAEAIYRRVLEAEPENADALHLLGIAMRQSGRPKEAIELIKRAIARNPRQPSYISNLGTALEAAGEKDAALAAYRRAIVLRPAFPEAYFKLGNLLQNTGKSALAAEALRRAVELKGDQAPWHLLLGTALAATAKHAEAAASLRRAAELDPTLADAHHKLGVALLALGRKDEAFAAYRRAVDVKADHDPALFALSTMMLERGDAAGLVKLCDEIIARDPGNRRMVSSKIVALTELGRRDEAKALLDFDRFLRPVEFATPPGYADLRAFNTALADEVTHHPTLVFEKSGHATRFGGHTGDILINPGPAVAALDKLIRAAVEEYSRTLDCPPDHPVRLAKLDQWRLQSWAVVMDTQGHQMPHIHPAAWLSGVYYVRIPVHENPRAPHAGWIEFGRPQDNMFAKAEPEVRLYRPKEGLMLLFPSYLYHMTVPIETKEQRISIAFDVVPKDKAAAGPY